MKRIAVLMALAMAFAVVGGCSSNKPMADGATKPIQAVNSPEWVLKGSGAFKGDQGKAFYGVGSAMGMSNTSLMRTTADNRARNDMAKIFSTYSASLSKDYQLSQTATVGGKGPSEDVQRVENAIKTVTTATVSGCEIVDHWQNPETGEIFSLARLDLKTFSDSLEAAKELNAKAKEYLKSNSDRAFDDLAKEEKKAEEQKAKQ